ncbi:ABC transporter permease [Microbacteriaceae bacterium VKM Ac-2854]|nr:ABC transporter permease [Microbacteriaceae bacterium VKM Ac-2854]
MRIRQFISRSIRSAFRNRLRTALTATAVAVGAFALTLTAALQTGVDGYIDRQLSTIGAPDLLVVTKDADADAPADAPSDYQEGRSAQRIQGRDILDDDDLERIARVQGVEWVQRTVSLETTWMSRPDGQRFVSRAEGNSDLISADLAAGDQLDRDADAAQLLLPVGYLDRFGFAVAADAIGEQVIVAVNDYTGAEHTVTGEIVGVQNKTLQGGSSGSLALNTAMTDRLFAAQTTGRPAELDNGYLQAVAKVDTGTSSVAEVKDGLVAASMRGQTFADQLGEFRSIVAVATAVLTGFAGIALIAAAFGIINTLLMSVKERTREIGLLKALGLRRGSLFLMFSVESTVIGVVGAGIGAGLAWLLWLAVAPSVNAELLSDLPSFDLLVFTARDVSTIVVAVVLVAVAAGALPALRASRMDPVTSLRYE